VKNFFDRLIEVLKHDERFFTEDGTLLRNKVYESALNMDAELIGLLLVDDDMKKRFFVDVGGTYVFDKIGFGWVVNNREFLPDSYTRFKNKIGLANSRGDLISASGDVVLAFPYKDCILEGGQTKDDQRRAEVFFNTTLAPDEVDRLLYPKVFVGAKRYSYSGVCDSNGIPVSNGKNDVSVEQATDYDNDNLIVKGNNLLAISSLLKRYEGRVKCIYLDPPYNTGGDSFQYNDSFNHTTWLSFMKTRLDISKRLLDTSGALFVHIDYHELGYLIPLMDEIFGKNNCVQIITVKTSSPAGFKTVNPGPIEVTEFILFYTKQRETFEFKKMYVSSDYDTNYDLSIGNPDDDPEKWRLEKLYNVVYRQNGIEVGKTPQQSSKKAKAKWGEHWKIIREQLMGSFALDNAERIVSVRDPQKPTNELKALLAKSKTERDKVFVYGKSDGESSGYVYNGGVLSFYSKKVRELDGEKTATELLTGLWTDISWDGIANEGGITLKNGKKPEKLLRRIIEMSTTVDDIVLDFYAGSGTTAAVAHKMGRRYIGVEQMDYIDDLTITRLKNVINGDTTGISKTIGWRGGGSFVYCELATCNQHFADAIEIAGTDAELSKLLNQVVQTGFISSKVNPAEITANATDFEALSIDDKKRFLMELLDMNMLYVNLSDLDDEEYGISEADKAFTRSFYGLEE
jgi:adenine-specific DNA-methyltransferase